MKEINKKELLKEAIERAATLSRWLLSLKADISQAELDDDKKDEIRENNALLSRAVYRLTLTAEDEFNILMGVSKAPVKRG